MRAGALFLCLAVVSLLILAQLILPRIAERRVRSELQDVATVQDVQVSAFPAVKLLFGDVDSLTARLGDTKASQSRVTDLIARTRRIDRLRVTAARARVAGLDLIGVRLAKDGSALRADAAVARSQLQALLPAGTTLDGVRTEGSGLRVDGTFDLFGAVLRGPVAVVPEDGAIVASPSGAGLLGALARLTLFSDPRVAVTALRGRDAGPQVGLGADALLR